MLQMQKRQDWRWWRVESAQHRTVKWGENKKNYKPVSCQPLHFPSSLHLYLPPCVCSLARLQLWTTKFFLSSNERHKLIISMFQIVLKPMSITSTPVLHLLSFIHPSQLIIWRMLPEDLSPTSPLYLQHDISFFYISYTNALFLEPNYNLMGTLQTVFLGVFLGHARSINWVIEIKTKI